MWGGEDEIYIYLAKAWKRYFQGLHIHISHGIDWKKDVFAHTNGNDFIFDDVKVSNVRKTRDCRKIESCSSAVALDSSYEMLLANRLWAIRGILSGLIAHDVAGIIAYLAV